MRRRKSNHVACTYGDVFNSDACDCHATIQGSLAAIAREGAGVLVTVFVRWARAGFGALGAGIIRTSLTTYTPAWIVAGSICLVAAVVVLRIGRTAPRLGLAREAVP